MNRKSIKTRRLTDLGAGVVNLCLGTVAVAASVIVTRAFFTGALFLVASLLLSVGLNYLFRHCYRP